MALQIDDLPPGLTLATLQSTLNDRIKNLNLILNGLMTNPATADLDMANFLIHNLADPVGDLDGVNLRTLKRFGGTAAAAVTAAPTTTPPPSTSGLDAYTIVSENTGLIGSGLFAPAFIVGLDRIGIPEETWLYAEVASAIDTSVNWQVQLAGSGPFQTLLSSDLTLPAGSLGPVFSTGFALRATFPHATVVKMTVTAGGQAAGVSAGVVMKRSS